MSRLGAPDEQGPGPSDPTAARQDGLTATPLTPITFALAAERLAAADPVLAHVVARWGPPPFWLHPEGFAGLVHAILAQQVSLESAVAAFARLERLLGAVEPESFLTLDHARLRELGFSRQKAEYGRGLAQSIVDGRLDLSALAAASDDEVRSSLVSFRGVGRWTADVYLLFALRRADAWPTGDLALAKSVQELWGLEPSATWAELDAWAGRWRPWRAVAARFLWHDYLSRRGRGWRAEPATDTKVST
jgi:DNA-3-methyladenine glycosylase II